MKKILSSTILGLVLTTTLLVGAVSVANAATDEDIEPEPGMHYMQEDHVEDLGHYEARNREMMQEQIERTIENIDDGVVMTITSDDPDVVERIQEHEQEKEARCENAEKTVELLDDGVQITITSDDEDTVSKIQNGVANGHRGKKGGPQDQ